MVRRYQSIARPTRVDDFRQFLGDVDTPAVTPAIFKPIDQFVAGIVLQHVNVQFALLGKAGECEVAAPQEAGDWVVGVMAVQQIELGVQRVAQIDLHDQLVATNLFGQLPERRFVFIGRDAKGQLVTKFLGNAALFADGCLVVQGILIILGAQCPTEFVGWRNVHADQQTTAMAVATRPAIDVFSKMTPTTQIEIADAEVGTFCDVQRFL